jgi:hypothetical protein
MRLTIATALACGALALAPGLAAAADEPSLEQLVVEMAQTPAQHAALARYYQGKAEQARAEARSHEQMSRSYTAGKLTEQQAMRRHCQDIAERYTGIAKDYDDLAKMHEAESKKAK